MQSNIPRSTMHIVASATANIAAVLITFLGLVVATTSSGSRNPPYHRFGGFDLALWWTGTAELVAALLATLLLRRSGYGHRYVVLGALAALSACIVLHVAMLLHALTQPPW